MRVALGIEYDGSAFHGWQRQPHHAHTIQEYLEKALSEIANSPIATICAGRTDAGVSACGQVVHFDTPVKRIEKAWVYGGNQKLPPQIRIQWAKEMDESFHARFSALSRTYRYVIYNDFYCPPILHKKVTFHPYPLNKDSMAKAAEYFIGEQDFSSFRGRGCQSHSTQRCVKKFTVKQKGKFFILEVTANAFLHHMVRNMVGTLMVVGEGKKEPAWIQSVLAARDRTKADKTASPDGLYLVKVKYPKELSIKRDIYKDEGLFFIGI